MPYSTVVNSTMTQVNEFDQAIVSKHQIYMYQDVQPTTKEFPTQPLGIIGGLN